MKIKLPRHEIVESQYISLKDIPLGYVNVDSVNKDPQIVINEEFTKSSKTYVRPFDTFSDSDPWFFNSYGTQLSFPSMKEVNGLYYYQPTDITEFVPLQFSVALDIKKRIPYRNNQQYNITVSVLESRVSNPISNTLISIFGDAYKTGVCPGNIMFNDGNLMPQQLTSTDINTADFVFMESYDGLHFGLGDSAEDLIDFDGYLSDHKNIWLTIETFGDMITAKTRDNIFDQGIEIEVPNPILYNQTSYFLNRSSVAVFNKETTFANFHPNIYDYIYISDCILVLHKPGNGYIIVSPSWVLENLADTYQMVYEAIMYVYLNAYKRSREITAWVTDSPVNYYAYQLQQYGKSYSNISISDLLTPLDETIGEDFDIVSVSVSSDAVRYTGLDDKNCLTFFKIGGDPDPVKKSDELSCITTKGTIIFYRQEDVCLLEEPIRIEASVADSGVYIVVQPYKSSANKICTVYAQTFQVTDFVMDYELFVSPSARWIDNKFSLLKRTDKPDDDMISVARISFNVGSEVISVDTRPFGGGLPEDQADDYNMLDIGYVKGRPYRIGGTLIVRLPRILRPYSSRIAKELEKHVAGGTYTVIIFEGDEV